MTIFLRQSTASQEIPLGYFVDATDGNTEETGLTIANTDIKIWKTGATTLASKNSGGATHISNGVYYCVLDATDTDTIGPLRVFVHVAGALSVKVDCVVLDEAVYDVVFGTTALSTYAGGAVASVTGAVGSVTAGVTVTTNNDKTGYGLSAAAVQAIWDALTSALTTVNSVGKLIVDNINTTISSRLASASYTAPLDAAGVRSAVGLASANLDTQLTAIDDAVDTEVAAVLAAVDTEVAAIISTLGTPAGASISADIAAIEAQTDDIGAAGAGLTAVPWNAAWDAEVQSEVDDALDSVIGDSVPADGSRPTVRQAVLMITRFLMEKSVSGTTVTVKKEDGTTSSMTFTLDSGTTPTSITRAS